MVVKPTRTDSPIPAAEDDVLQGINTHRWFSVIWMIYLFDYADRFAISAVLPSIQAEFALNDAQLGLMSGSLFLGLAILAVPCGLAVDRFSRKYMITIMTLVWSVATWSTGLARSFGELMLARILVGAGEAGYNPAGYALIAAWYPQHRRGTMVGLFNMAQPLGVGLGIIIAGYLGAKFGWRAVFGLLALPGILLALLMLFAPDYKTSRIDPGKQQLVRPGLLNTLGYIGGSRTLQMIYLAQLPITMYIATCGIWGPTFFVREYGMSLSAAASAVGIITIVAGFGALCGGWLSDRVSRNNRKARISICLLYLAIPLVLHSIAWLGAMRELSLPLFILCFAVGQFFAAANWGTLVAAGLDLSPPQYRATAQSFLPMFQAIATLGAGIVSGLLSDRYGLPPTMLILLITGMLGGLLLLNVARIHYDRDQQRTDSLGNFSIEVPSKH